MIGNRHGEGLWKEYDLVEGGIANDRIFNTIELYDSGLITREEALNRTLENMYDVILMDHQMPGMDGVECLHRIRTQENGKCQNSKIVCLTANVGVEMEKQFMQEGFDGYLSKPVKGKTLECELIRVSTI